MCPGTAAATSSPSQPSALPLNPGTDPSDVPDPSAKTLEDTETWSPGGPQGPADAALKNADGSDIGHDAADDAADAAAQAAGTGSRAGADQNGIDAVGYWQVAWLYLTSLLKLGEAYEIAGSHEDAMHAFKEGLELVCYLLSLTPSLHPNLSPVQLHNQAWPMHAVHPLYMTFIPYMATNRNMVDQNTVDQNSQLLSGS